VEADIIVFPSYHNQRWTDFGRPAKPKVNLLIGSINAYNLPTEPIQLLSFVYMIPVFVYEILQKYSLVMFVEAIEVVDTIEKLFSG